MPVFVFVSVLSRSRMPVKFPCVSCSQPVKSNQHGIFCNVCERWIHLRCTSFSLTDYNNLASDDSPWICHICLGETFPFGLLDEHEFQSIIYEKNYQHSDFDSYCVDPENPFHSSNNSQYYSSEQFLKTFSCIAGFPLLHINMGVGVK